MPEINVCPGILAKGFSTYSPMALRALFDRRKVSHVLPFASRVSEESAELFIQNRKRISISGVQEKLSLVLEKNKLRLTKLYEHGTYILKPTPRDVKNVTQVPANEHLTMQIARQVYSMETAANAIIFFEDGEPAYITRRFDAKPDGTRWGKEDFASLAGKSADNAGDNFKYESSYEEMGLLIRKFVPSWQIEIEKFFNLVVFNFLFMNGDAHLKNFSLLETADGDYRLAPAYDLMNTRLHIDDQHFAFEKELFEDDFRSVKYQSGLHPAKEDFIEFGRRVGVKEERIEVLLTPFLSRQESVETLTNRSFLDEKMKRGYLHLYQQQRNYLNAI
ncbi:MAG TPA: HipA domain-containing protein [Pyrinomonadaceae bacterium]|jgi:serine/threonine-protein kinase HipA|nr:HipA domain-containing protein [Pyrinomonadaceae bacterium]